MPRIGHTFDRWPSNDPARAAVTGSLGDGDLLLGIEHRDFLVLVRRAVRQPFGKISSKFGYVPKAAATLDSITQGDDLAVGQLDCLILRIPRGAVRPDDWEFAHHQAPTGQGQ